jgi:hypothetical protein
MVREFTVGVKQSFIDDISEKSIFLFNYYLRSLRDWTSVGHSYFDLDKGYFTRSIVLLIGINCHEESFIVIFSHPKLSKRCGKPICGGRGHDLVLTCIKSIVQIQYSNDCTHFENMIREK